MENYERGFGADAPVQENTAQEPSQEIIVEVVSDQNDQDGQPEQPEKTVKRQYRDTGKTRLNQIQREKYQAINERDAIAAEYSRMAEENERLRRISEYSTSAALTQYETGAHDRLLMAKEKKVKAIEEGDVKAQVDADEIMAAATAELVQLQYSKSQQNVQQAQEREAYESQVREQQAYQNVAPDIANRHIADSWVMDNEWFNSKSPNFDPQLSGIVEQLTDKLDAQLMREGNAHQIFTPEYFQYIDQYVAQVQQQRQPQQQYRDEYSQRRTPMPSPRTPVSPVRNGYGSSQRTESRRVQLSSADMDMARRLNVSPETFAKHKEADRRKQSNKGDGRSF